MANTPAGESSGGTDGDRLKYERDTMGGNAVQVRVYITEPSKITKDSWVSDWVKGSDVNKVRGIFEKRFKNKICLTHLDNPDPWSQAVQIAAKVDLTGMNAESVYLYFYSYDKAKNQYVRITAPNTGSMGMDTCISTLSWPGLLSSARIRWERNNRIILSTDQCQA